MGVSLIQRLNIMNIWLKIQYLNFFGNKYLITKILNSRSHTHSITISFWYQILRLLNQLIDFSLSCLLNCHRFNSSQSDKKQICIDYKLLPTWKELFHLREEWKIPTEYFILNVNFESWRWWGRNEKHLSSRNLRSISYLIGVTEYVA